MRPSAYPIFLLVLFLNPSLEAQDCTLTKIYHQYQMQGIIYPFKLLYHQTVNCDFELDLLDNPDDVDKLFGAIRDTVVTVVDINLSKIDVDTASDANIIEQLYNLIGFYNLRACSREQAFHFIEWTKYFSNFGLLEGRTVLGQHPNHENCTTFISFNSITRQDEVTSIEDVLDVKGNICGERYLGKNGIELFRVYFDSSVTNAPHRLQPSFLPKFLIDP